MKRLRVEVEVPTARQVMNEHVFTFGRTMEVAEAVRRLLARGYAGAPVVDDEFKLVGVFSEADCVRVLSEAAYEGWPTGTVGDHMTKDVEVVSPEVDVFTLAEKFRAGRHRRFPVVDASHRLVGLISRRDLLRSLDLFRREQERARLANTYELIEHRRQQLA